MSKVIVLVAALAAMVAGGFLADRMLRRPAESDSAAEAPGRPVPDVVLQGLDGEPLALERFTGRPLLVNFWATWCKPCRHEIPLLVSLRREFSEAGLEVVGIAIDTLEDTRELAGELGVDYPVMVGEQAGIDAMTAFGAPTTALPYTAVVDREGRIVADHVGELSREDALALLGKVL